MHHPIQTSPNHGHGKVSVLLQIESPFHDTYMHLKQHSWLPNVANFQIANQGKFSYRKFICLIHRMLTTKHEVCLYHTLFEDISSPCGKYKLKSLGNIIKIISYWLPETLCQGPPGQGSLSHLFASFILMVSLLNTENCHWFIVQITTDNDCLYSWHMEHARAS